MKNAPFHWTIDSIARHINGGDQAQINGRYVPARPFGYFSLGSRFRLALAVFCGRADALFWEGQ